MAEALTRHARAVEKVCACIAAASDVPAERICRDDDLVDDLALDGIELESLGLMLEEIFAIKVPDELWTSPLHRTPTSLAEWCIARSEEASWAESQRQRKRA